MKAQLLAILDDIAEVIIRPFVVPLDTQRERFQWNVGKCSATISLVLLLLIVWCFRFPLPGKGTVITLSMTPAGETMQTISLPLDQGVEDQEEKEEQEEEADPEEPESVVEPQETSPPEEAAADTPPAELPLVDHGRLATNTPPAATNATGNGRASATPPPGSGDPYNRSGGGLAQSNIVSDKTILIYSNCKFAIRNVCGNPRLIQLLTWMGFRVEVKRGPFQTSWLDHADQLWIFAGAANENAISKRGYAAIEQYIRRGKPTYLCAENAPFTHEVWVLGHRLMKRFKVGGNYGGRRLIKVASRHPILTGIDTIYEGDTIAKFQIQNRHVKPLLNASNGDLLVACSPQRDRWRLVIDGGWTRYYPDTMQGGTNTGAGTELYVTNLAAWLAGAKPSRRIAAAKTNQHH